MLNIKNLRKIYKGSTKGIQDLTLTIESGDICAFIGANGAGKTTTLKSIVGIHPYDKGEILLNGVDLQKEAKKFKMMIGYSSDNPDVYGDIGSCYYPYTDEWSKDSAITNLESLRDMDDEFLEKMPDDLFNKFAEDVANEALKKAYEEMNIDKYFKIVREYADTFFGVADIGDWTEEGVFDELTFGRNEYNEEFLINMPDDFFAGFAADVAYEVLRRQEKEKEELEEELEEEM